MKVLQEQLRPQSWELLFGLDNKPIGPEGPTQKQILIDLFVEDRAMSVIFNGPPGTGKTSAAQLCAKTYLGEHYDTKFKVYNASSEINKSVVSKDMSEFAGTEDESGLRNVIFLDEADGIPWQAQDALRAIIEHYSYSCIFILGVNRFYRLHEALVSRSAIFQFDSVPPEEASKWMKIACETCNITISDNVIDEVLTVYKGDLRHIVTDFLTKYIDKTVTSWEPPKTYSEEIFKANDPIEKYLSLCDQVYIDPIQLLYNVWKLNGKIKTNVFSDAMERVKNAIGNDSIIHVCMGLSEIKK